MYLITYKQQFLHSDWLRAYQFILKSAEKLNWCNFSSAKCIIKMIDRSGQVAASCNWPNKMADKSETGFELKNTVLIKRSHNYAKNKSKTEIPNYQEVRTRDKTQNNDGKSKA